MTATIPAPSAEPILRTLVPALRLLERDLRSWLASPVRRTPIAPLNQATLQGIADDLRRKADDLDLDRPHLTVLLMGGTGVGKSSLLNALAGGAVAQASFTRPTTREPVVYHHRSLRIDRLHPALRRCHLTVHDREPLADKLLVDTPDLDSNAPENRDRLEAVLPLADIVLYVGSQEKYHDRIGWEMFRRQRHRRAFAFVLNKWDRCLHPTHTGLRPDEDLLRDLKSEGFQEPLIFRTSAQYWIDRQASSAEPIPPPDGDQFPELVRWLEEGLSHIEIEALKARGIGQLLDQCATAIEQARPPDLTAAAGKVRTAWEQVLTDEADALAELLLRTLEPNQQEIEHHFRLEGQRRFQRLMAAYLGTVTRLQYAGSKLRERLTPASRTAGPAVKATWDLAGFTHECLRVAGERGLNRRVQALGNRLTVAADAVDFPAELLPERLKDLARLDWRDRCETAVNEALGTVERQWVQPAGAVGVLHGGLVGVANFLPEATFVGAVLVLLWRYFMVPTHSWSLFDAFVPFLLTLAVLMVLHLLTHLLLPMHWPAIRGNFQKLLEKKIRSALAEAYLPVPAAVADDLAKERRSLDELLIRVRGLKRLLDEQRRASKIDALYGHKAGDAEDLG